jgi:hypothetical protein
MNTTHDLRRILIESLVQAREGKLAGDALRGVIGCANQINQSIGTETRARTQLIREGVAVESFGKMKI